MIDKVIVYFEGTSDVACIKTLLKPIVEEKAEKGIAIHFHNVTEGDHKERLVTTYVDKARNILKNNKKTIVVLCPDLYPPNKGFKHETFEQLNDGIYKRFNDNELQKRFRVFCFKYDLEVLLLASVEGLKEILKTDNFKVDWKIPVEDQNHGKSPKKVIQELFLKHFDGKKQYKETFDAPLILNSINYKTLKERCPQCFKPFVEFLEEV